MIRAVILARPVHMYRFIADMLDVELAQRTFDDIMYGCMLKKSKRLEPYPTESCKLFDSFLAQTKLEIFGEDQFTMGPIPDYELERPALDRYRDYAGIGTFDMTTIEVAPEPDALQTAQLPEPPTCKDEAPVSVEAPATREREISFERGPLPDYELQEPALDRYRDYAGIEPFDLIGDECNLHEPLCRYDYHLLYRGATPNVLSGQIPTGLHLLSHSLPFTFPSLPLPFLSPSPPSTFWGKMG